MTQAYDSPFPPLWFWDVPLTGGWNGKTSRDTRSMNENEYKEIQDFPDLRVLFLGF